MLSAQMRIKILADVRLYSDVIFCDLFPEQHIRPACLPDRKCLKLSSILITLKFEQHFKFI